MFLYKSHISSGVSDLYEQAKKLDFTRDFENADYSIEEYRDFQVSDEIIQEVIHHVVNYRQQFEINTQHLDLVSTSVLRLKEGEAVQQHVDDQIDENVFRSIAVLVYLNTVEGGLLIFPNQSEVIEAEAGKIVIFPSNFCFPHLVTPPNKNRYALRFNFGKILSL